MILASVGLRKFMKFSFRYTLSLFLLAYVGCANDKKIVISEIKELTIEDSTIDRG